MNWRHETWRKLYAREEGSFAALSYWARSLAAMLLKLCDDRGRIFARPGEVVEEAVCFRLAADQGARRVIRRALAELMADGYLVRTDGCLRIRNFGRAHGVDEPATSGAPAGRQLGASQARVELEPGASVDRVGIEECVKTAESPETPSVVPSVPFPSVPSLPSIAVREPEGPRAIPEPWSRQEPELQTYHHAAVRTPAVSVGGPDSRSLRQRSPPPPGPGWTAQRILDTFGRLRSEIIRGAPPWDTPGAKAYVKAVDFLESLLGKPDAQADIEPTMRRYLLSVRSSTKPEDKRVSWLYACWLDRFDDLRGELRNGGQEPPLVGLTDKERKNLENTRLFLEQMARKEAERMARQEAKSP